MFTLNISNAIEIPRTRAEYRRGVDLDRLSKDSHSPARPVEVSRKGVMLARLNLGQQLFDGPLYLREFLSMKAVRFMIV